MSFSKLPERVTHQNCSDVLLAYGVSAPPTGYINVPWREDTDKKLHLKDNVWFDNGTGEGGHVGLLAEKLVGKDEAFSLLCRAANFTLTSELQTIADGYSTRQMVAFSALTKVREKFPISFAPQTIKDYLAGRKLSEKSWQYLSYIPGMEDLDQVLPNDEKQLTGLWATPGRIIAWYLKDDAPIYYAHKSISEKGYRFAPSENSPLERPLWNGQLLRTAPHLVLGEGLFDCLSLVELRYSVCSGLSCNLSKDNINELIITLRWRQKHNPDWTFTICLDDDQINKDGRRPGNEAAEQLATKLFANGIDAKWVKHNSPPETQKTDINALHQTGDTLKITRMIDSARLFSESLTMDDGILCRQGVDMITSNPFRAGNIFSILEKKLGKGMRDIVKDQFKARTNWRNVYNSHIEDMWQNNDGVWVLFRRGEHPETDDVMHYPVYRVTEALRQYQTTAREISLSILDIPEKSSVYDISLLANPHPNQRNIFRPAPVLTERLDNSNYPMPPMWDKVLDNLADAGEKQYLINHLATFVNTLDI